MPEPFKGFLRGHFGAIIWDGDAGCLPTRNYQAATILKNAGVHLSTSSPIYLVYTPYLLSGSTASNHLEFSLELGHSVIYLLVPHARPSLCRTQNGWFG